LTHATRRESPDFERILEAVVQKLKAASSEVAKSRRTRLTVHNSAKGTITVELETKH
jgi:hypothetical protein